MIRRRMICLAISATTRADLKSYIVGVRCHCIHKTFALRDIGSIKSPPKNMSSKPKEEDIQLQHRDKKPDDIGAETIEAVRSNSFHDRSHGDKAAQFLEANAPDHQHVVVTPEDNKRVLRKIDLALLPILLGEWHLGNRDRPRRFDPIIR
jgi:hypothetical protein